MALAHQQRMQESEREADEEMQRQLQNKKEAEWEAEHKKRAELRKWLKAVTWEVKKSKMSPLGALLGSPQRSMEARLGRTEQKR